MTKYLSLSMVVWRLLGGVLWGAGGGGGLEVGKVGGYCWGRNRSLELILLLIASSVRSGRGWFCWSR